MKAERNRKIIYWLLPLAGILFCLWYVKSATCDVVYSDYIRLVNSYLRMYGIRRSFLCRMS